MRFAALLDGTTTSAPRQARALAAFLAGGLTAGGPTGAHVTAEGSTGEGLAGETVIFVTDDCEAQELVALAPTRDVRLVRVPLRRPDLAATSLLAAARGGETELFLAPAGPWGAEVLTRLTCGSDGAVLTGVLDAELTGVLGGARLWARANVYSNHMAGRFELSRRPWCVALDASWNDARPLPRRLTTSCPTLPAPATPGPPR